MLFSPLGQHILDYEPPYGFAILAFTTFDGLADPYDSHAPLHSGNGTERRQQPSVVQSIPSQSTRACAILVPQALA